MTAVATTQRQHPVVALMQTDDARNAILAMLPEGQTVERVMREFYLAAADNPDILKCEPGSIVRALSRAVSWDLVIGDTAFLVPRGGKLCAQQGYRGKIELMVRHRAARFVDAQAVYENDVFSYTQGTRPGVEHVPVMDPRARGELIGAYAYAKLTQYEIKLIVMSKQEIDEIRKRYSHQWKGGTLDAIPWYALKTALHRLAKQIPMTPKLARLLTDDDEEPEVEPPVIAPNSDEERLLLRKPASRPDDVQDDRELGDEDDGFQPPF